MNAMQRMNDVIEELHIIIRDLQREYDADPNPHTQRELIVMQYTALRLEQIQEGMSAEGAAW